MGKPDTAYESDTLLEDDTDLKEPPQYQVILLNDDYTHQQFVVTILQSIFRKSIADAERIMLTVHYKGQAVCGIYPKQIAETKTELVHQRARSEGFPLRCVMEEI